MVTIGRAALSQQSFTSAYRDLARQVGRLREALNPAYGGSYVPAGRHHYGYGIEPLRIKTLSLLMEIEKTVSRHYRAIHDTEWPAITAEAQLAWLANNPSAVMRLPLTDYLTAYDLITTLSSRARAELGKPLDVAADRKQNRTPQYGKPNSNTKQGRILVDGPAAATELGVTPTTIRSWRHRGKIRAHGWDNQNRALYDLNELTAVMRA